MVPAHPDGLWKTWRSQSCVLLLISEPFLSASVSVPSGHRCPCCVLALGLKRVPGGGGVLLDCHRGCPADGLYQVVGPGKHTTVLIVTRDVAQVLREERRRSLGPHRGGKRWDVDGFVADRNAQRPRHFLRDRVVVQFLWAVERIDLTVVWFGVGQDGRDNSGLVCAGDRGVPGVSKRQTQHTLVLVAHPLPTEPVCEQRWTQMRCHHGCSVQQPFGDPMFAWPVVLRFPPRRTLRHVHH